MNCEYCSSSFADLAEARKHMLTVTHIRRKNIHELQAEKLLEKMRNFQLHPKSFRDLAKVINMHSRKDVEALNSIDFFKIKIQKEANITNEFIAILYQSINDYRVNVLPPTLREPFLRAIAEQEEDVQE